jgi:hypothetical protein
MRAPSTGPVPTPPSRRELVCVALVYLGLTLWWISPLTFHLATHSSSESPNHMVDADYYLIGWALTWGAHILVRAPWRIFHANSFYPSTLSLAYSEHFLGQQPLFAPTYWATGNPVLAMNGLIIAGNVASATATYALVRRFASGPGAFVAGILFAFCPSRYHMFWHVHMLGVQYLPLAILLAERWFRDARPRDAVLLAGALTLNMLSSVYLAYIMVVLLAVYSPAALWHWRQRIDRRRLLGYAAAGLFAATAMGLLCLPYFHLMRVGLIPAYEAEGRPPPIGIFAAPRMLDTYLREDGVGLVGYGLALAALLPPWRGRRWPIALAALLAVAGLLIGSGPVLLVGSWAIPTPFNLLARTLPGFGSIRVAVRFALLTQLGLSLLAGLAVARLATLAPVAARWPAAVAAALAIFWTWSPIPPRRLDPQPVGATVPPVYRWLAEHGDGRAVLEIPMLDLTGEGRRMFLSTVHWLPMVNGYSGYPPQTAHYVHWLSRGLPSQRALQSIVDTVDVGWIVVHTDELPGAADWEHRLPAGLRVAARFPDTLVLDVSLPGNQARRARFLSERETLEGLPLEPIADRCPGHIALAAPPPTSVAFRDVVTIPLLVSNDGDRSWPGFGFVPRHLVQVNTCMRRDDTEPCWTDPQSLPSDVHPGRPVRVDVRVPAPPFPAGPRRIRIELVQFGDGPLARCGVEPLIVPIEVVPPKPPATPAR